MVEVALHGAEFFARHGFYAEEQLLGNTFLVDVEVTFEPISVGDDNLSNTLNYERLYELVSAEMQKTHKLLETVAQAIADKIKAEFAFAETILVKVKKLSPPLSGKVAYSAVTVTYKK